MVILDLGTGITDPLAQFAIERADQTVVITTPEWITAASVLGALRYLQLEEGTLVLNQAPAGSNADYRDVIEENFRLQAIATRATIPYDPAHDARHRHLRPQRAEAFHPRAGEGAGGRDRGQLRLSMRMAGLKRRWAVGSGALFVLVALAMGTTVSVRPAQATPAHLSAFAAARRAWTRSACVAAAGEGPAWRAAAADLRRARPLTKGDRAAIARLYDLARLPETSETKQQMREFGADAKTLDRFFHTPGMFLKAVPRC